jgi:PPM family protein phosphatase
MTELGLVRTNNEDNYAVVNLTSKAALEIQNKQQILACGGNGVLLIVADGAGAEKAGEIASEIVVTVMREHLINALEQENGVAAIEDHLADAVRAAHSRVVDEAAQGVNLTGMASTVVAMVLLGDTAHIVEIGDSRVYVYRAGKLTQVTKDQNQAQMLIDAGVLSPQDAKSSLARNILLQAMGKSEELIIVQRKVKLRDGDRFLLCSDGLTSHVPDPDISNIIGSTVLLNEICEKLVALTLERGARDNVTVVMCHVTGQGLTPPNEAENAQDTITTLRDFSFTPAE